MNFTMRFLLPALCCGAACAQGIQNRDIFVSAGPIWTAAHPIAGTNAALAGATGFTFQVNYGYQFARISAASLMADVSFIFGEAGDATGNGTVPASMSFTPVTGGLRLMLPLHSRLSLYTVAGGGGGSFHAPVITQSGTLAHMHTTSHGAFVFGGGTDVRLTRWFSLRGEVRDLVTGRGLSGASGRHHVLPLFGFAFHL
jgi:hypothetical protein